MNISGRQFMNKLRGILAAYKILFHGNYFNIANEMAAAVCCN